jgi:hypothetical protein
MPVRLLGPRLDVNTITDLTTPLWLHEIGDGSTHGVQRARAKTT